MELNEYQKKAMGTCLPSCNNFSYMMLNLVGEVGEFAGKVAKEIRKDQWMINGNGKVLVGDAVEKEKLKHDLRAEAGDILWQLSGLCSVMGWSLEEVAQMNLDKLAARKVAGTIIGNGDGIIREK